MTDFSIEHLKSALDIDREPFCNDGVTGLFYPGAGRQDILEQLLHLSRYGSSVVFLLGENGSGKTTVLDQFELALDPSMYKWVRISADVLADERFILDSLSSGFRLDLGPDLDSAIQVLSRFARELDSYSQTPMLIVDETQNLSASAIELVVSIAGLIKNTAFKILLVADGETVAQIPLLKPFVGEVEFQELPLPPLDQDCCAEYLEYRMTTSGLGEIRFNQDQIEQLCRTSQGNIDKLNILARELLVNAFPYHRNKKKLQLPAYHMIVVGILGVVLMAAYLFLPNAVELDVLPVKPPSDLRVNTNDSGLEGGAVAVDESVLVEDSNIADVATSGDQSSEVELEVQLDSFSQAADEIDYNYSESPESDILQPVGDESGNYPGDAEAERVEVEAASNPEPTVSAIKLQQQAASSDSLPKSYSPREQWLMSLDDKKFTLQMLGAREEASVQKFLARYPSLKDIAYYQTIHRDEDWYVVVYGLFSSKEGAKSELSKLPKSLRDSKPWPRSIASVQEDIRKRPSQ